MPYICPICKGERRVGGHLCWACHGSAQFEDHVCDGCFGLGEVGDFGNETACRACGGSGRKPGYESPAAPIVCLSRRPTDAEVDRVTALVERSFPTFGRRSRGRRAAFSAGVDVADVVKFVLASSPAPQVAPVLADDELDRAVLMLAARGKVRSIDVVTEAVRDGLDLFLGQIRKAG